GVGSRGPGRSPLDATVSPRGSRAWPGPRRARRGESRPAPPPGRTSPRVRAEPFRRSRTPRPGSPKPGAVPRQGETGAERELVERGVAALPPEQLGVGAGLDQLTVPQHEDPVGALNC